MRRSLFWLVPSAVALTAFGVVGATQLRGSRCKGCVVTLGDSITLGTGLSRQESYPAQLDETISSRVWNAGVSGDTVSEAGARLDRILRRHRPQTVVILLGINDCGIFAPPTPVASVEEDLQAIVRAIRAASAVPLLCSLLPVEPNVLAQRGLSADRWEDYDMVVRRVAESGALPLVDLTSAVGGRGGLLLDGLHPNREGSSVIARAVADALEQAAQAPSTANQTG